MLKDEKSKCVTSSSTRTMKSLAKADHHLNWISLFPAGVWTSLRYNLVSVDEEDADGNNQRFCC